MENDATRERAAGADTAETEGAETATAEVGAELAGPAAEGAEPAGTAAEGAQTAGAELGGQVRSAVGRLYRRFRSERPEGGLGDTALAVLSRLHKHGPQTRTDLSEHDRVSPASMSQTVNRLTSAGYAVRTRDPDDRRKVLFSTTAEGNELASAARAQRNAWLDQRLQALSAEDRALMPAPRHSSAASLTHDWFVPAALRAPSASRGGFTRGDQLRGDGGVVDGEGLVRDPVPGVAGARAVGRGHAERLEHHRVGEELADPLREQGRAAGLDQDAGGAVDHGVDLGADGGGDDRGAARHRLDGRDRGRLVLVDVDEQVGRAQQRRQGAAADLAREEHPASQVEGVAELGQPAVRQVGLEPIAGRAAGHDELRARDLGQRAQQGVERVLLGGEVGDRH